jgi:hypothetical protein
VSRPQSCFPDPLVLEGVAGPSAGQLVGAACVPRAGGALDQAAGLPGPATLILPTALTTASCGDGVANGREECDGGDDAACPGACQAGCTCPRTCGNGVVEGSEQCDGVADLACPGACAPPGAFDECTCPTTSSGQCGNGTLDPGEACEFPATGCGPLQLCLLCGTCFPPPGLVPAPGGGVGAACGNQVLDAGETCELSGTGCAAGELCLFCDACLPFIPGVLF